MLTEAQAQVLKNRWIKNLKEQGDRQCKQEYFDGYGKACALGILAETAHNLGFIDLHIEDLGDGYYRYEWDDICIDNFLQDMKLRDDGMIAENNDAGVTFEEIAARIEKGNYDEVEDNG